MIRFDLTLIITRTAVHIATGANHLIRGQPKRCDSPCFTVDMARRMAEGWIIEAAIGVVGTQVGFGQQAKGLSTVMDVKSINAYTRRDVFERDPLLLIESYNV